MAGGIYEQLDWPDSRSDYVQVCDGCHTGDLVDPLERGDIGRFRRFPRQERLARLHRPARSPDPEPLPGMRGARPAPRRDSDSCRLADPPRTLLHARRPGGLRPTDRPRTDGGEPAADRRLTKTEHLAAPAQTQTPRNGHNAGNGWTGSFPSPCFLLSATENPSVGSIPTSGTP